MASAAEILRQFERNVSRLRGVRESVDKALDAGALRQLDVDHVYESTFLSAVSSLEVFLEELFYSCLLEQSGMDHVQPQVVFRSRQQAREVVLGLSRSRYATWLPFDDTHARAQSLLAGARPFHRLRHRGKERGVLTTVQTVRNAIAHSAGDARARFLRLPMGHLASSKKNPAGFLQDMVGLQAESRHSVLLGEVTRIARALAAGTDTSAAVYLLPADAWASGMRAPRGKYSCANNCGTTALQVSASVKLPICATCNTGPCQTCNREHRSFWDKITV